MPAANTSTSTTISTTAWTVAMLEEMNVLLKKQGKKAIPITNTNIANIQRMIAVESEGNTAGFLRDNNPLNLGTWASPHQAVYGGKIVQEFGVYATTFSSPLQGAVSTAVDLVTSPRNTALVKVLQNNGNAAMFGGALGSSEWSSAKYANAKVFPTVKPFTGTSKANAPLPQGATPPGLLLQLETAAVNQANAETGGLLVPAATAVGNAAKTVSSAAGGLAGLEQLASNLGSGTWWKRIGIGAAGVALIIGGVAIWISQTDAGKAAIGVATKAAAAA